MTSGPRDEASGGPAAPDDAVGNVAEEAAKLLGALSEWAAEHGPDLQQTGDGLAEDLVDAWAEGWGGLVDRAAAAAQQVAEHVDTGAPECAWCPVCRTVHLVRATSPEVREHLSVAATSLLRAATGILAATGTPHRAPAPGVEHIDLAEDTDDWPEEDR